MVEPGRHIPVDKPDVVTVLVFAHFLEQHSSPFEGAVVFAGENVPRELLAFYFQLANLF
jgi:hypothetical protein